MTPDTEPRFYVTRPVGGGKFYLIFDATLRETDWTHVKRDASTFTSDEADIFAEQHNKLAEQFTSIGEAQVEGAGKQQ